MLKRRNRIRLAAYILAALLVFTLLLLRSRKRAKLWEEYTENSWHRAFGTLSADMTEIDTALKKCGVSGSEALVGEAAVEIYARAQEVQTLLGELPLSNWQLGNITGYLGKLGDYALALSRSAFRGKLTAEERETLNALGEAASKLNEGFLSMQAALEDGSLTVGELQMLSAELPEGTSLLGDDLLLLEDEFPELPTLVYDGPYSESAVVGPARMLEGLSEVSEAEALTAAAAFTGRQAADFSLLGVSEGTLPCFLFTAGQGTDAVTLRVTRQGGMVADMVCSHAAEDGLLRPEKAVEKAKTFLADRGYDAVRETYWTKENGTLLISFAGVQDGWVCYPDLIKVRVALSDGEIVGFDAAGYLLNHTGRTFPEAADADTARRAVSPALRVITEGLAVIPKEGKQERCCREYKCEAEDGTHFIVYLDAETNEEVKLLMLLEDENGTLAM